jgi:hypothetical protein
LTLNYSLLQKKSSKRKLEAAEGDVNDEGERHEKKRKHVEEEKAEVREHAFQRTRSGGLAASSSSK